MATNFKAYFTRDFPYGTDSSTVMDADINKAINLVLFTINSRLFGTQQNYTTGYLLLAAHYLVMNLRASSQGISGQYSWLQSSKGVGSVSEGLSIPQRILDNPSFAMLTKTSYGAQYLELVLPLLSGQMFTTFAEAHP